MIVALACASAAAAAYVAVRPSPAHLLSSRLGPRLAATSPRSTSPRTVPIATWLAGIVVAVVAVSQFGPAALMCVVPVGIAALAVPRVRAQRKRARARTAHRQLVVEACEALAGELRAGRTPQQALEGAAGVLPELGSVAAARRMGSGVPGALRRVGADDAEALGLIAAAWQAAEDTGAGLADVIDRVARGLRDDADLRREVSAQLAAPRATARLLSALPVLGILLGTGIGAEPLTILLGTPYGVACLVLGIGLAAFGVWWVERLARAAESP